MSTAQEQALEIELANNTAISLGLCAAVGWIFFLMCFFNYASSATECGIAKHERDLALGYLRANGVTLEDLINDKTK